MHVTRRDVLELAMKAAALPGASRFLSEWWQAGQATHPRALHAPPQPPFLRDHKPVFFADDDFAALETFTAILIPTDDTPGAREALCAHYIDFALQAADPPLQSQWRRAMAALKDAGFHSATEGARMELVRAMARPETDRTASHPLYPVFRLIKQQATFAFYTSRAGIIEALDYRGNTFNAVFPACTHPEHQVVS
jgi:Gluconate 2-dehydrogenase subunit 3